MGTQLPPPKKGPELPIFGQSLVWPDAAWPNGWMDQDGIGTEAGLGSATLC